MAKINIDMARFPDDTKFKELVLYIAKKSETDESFGSTKLNKLLFYCDFLAFAELGRAITWHQYQKLQWGPAARRLLPIQDQMERNGECEIQTKLIHTYSSERIRPLRDPDTSVFSQQELTLIDSVIKMFSKHGASSLSALSHKFIGWQVSCFKEVIPYETALLSQRPLTENEKKYALDLKPSYG